MWTNELNHFTTLSLQQEINKIGNHHKNNENINNTLNEICIILKKIKPTIYSIILALECLFQVMFVLTRL